MKERGKIVQEEGPKRYLLPSTLVDKADDADDWGADLQKSLAIFFDAVITPKLTQIHIGHEVFV